VDKAPDAFRTISEVAEEIDVPQHVLRFWESRFTQIRPLKRGGGRRYYRPHDVDLLRGVRHLLYGEGYTIRGVQRLLREQGLSFVQSVWREDAERAAAADIEDGVADAARDDVEMVSDDEASPSETASGLAGERREPQIVPPTNSAHATRRLGAEERRKLQTALDDLIACSRLLDAAISEAPAAQE